VQTYVVGDVHGCYAELNALLDKIQFNETTDTLWFVGDLVNRGPQSLETLRFIKSLGQSAVSVLGNHDIHLLAVYYGLRAASKSPTLDAVLSAPDAPDLIHWLQQQPLLFTTDKHILVHAGVYPLWDLATAQQLATEVSRHIASIDSTDAMAAVYGETVDHWSDVVDGTQRLRFAANCFTRMRFCDAGARLDLKHNGAPGSQPTALRPWFEITNTMLSDYTVLFGHWASLGFHRGSRAIGLDSGCAWGNRLSALRLSDQQLFSVPAAG